MTSEELNNLQAEAYDHLWHGRYRLALSAAIKLCELRPNDSEAVICAAWAYLENGNPLKAMEYANLAVELKGDSSRTRFFRAYLLTRMSIYEGAIADIEKNIDKEKELLSWTLLTKARAYAGIKKFDEAIKTFDNAALLTTSNIEKLNEQKQWFIKAKTIENYEVTNKNIDQLISDGKEALKAKEYWFALLTAQKILSQDKVKDSKYEAALLEIEAMYFLFQYRPAYQKALTLKNKLKSNEKFNLIFNSLQKFVLAEEEELIDKTPLRKTQTDLNYSFSDEVIANPPEIEFRSESVFYPNDYAELFSIKIFDALKDSKTSVRDFYKNVNKNMPALGVEVIFNNPYFRIENKTYNCYTVWYLNDYEINRNNFRLNIPKEWDSVIFSQSINSENSNRWETGQAKVEVYINNFKIGERTFGICKSSSPEEEITAPPTPITSKKDEKSEQKKNILPVKSTSIEQLLFELDSFIGLTNIKQTVRDFISYLQFINERKKHGLKTDERIAINAIFLGNPGTGKTTVARLLGNILKSIGILPSGHVVEVDRSALVGQYIGETAQKTEKIINDAIGGVLFIDEAYTLIKKGGSGQDFGQEAIDILLKRMEDKKGEFVVVAAGYTEEMNSFLNANPGLKSRFTHTFTFEDYTPEELMEIFKLYLKKDDYSVENSAEELLKKEFVRLYRGRDKSFGNARLVKNIFDGCKLNLGKRVVSLPQTERTKDILNKINEEDIKQILQKTSEKKFVLTINEENLSEALKDLDNLVGLETVKREINDLVKLARFFAEQGEDLREKFGNHYLFLGNPGTGKTTVARIFSRIFSAIGVLSKGHLVETDRQGLVAGYVGQTAEKTSTLIDKAIGGTLFIDEAYALVKPDGSGSDFGKEAIDILLKRMEDDRSKFIVIAAGYTEEMQKFIASNPGMQSRFSKSITFEDYSPKELMEIVYRNLKNDKKNITKDADEALFKHFAEIYKSRDKKFGNARIVRNILDTIKQKMLLRIADIPQSERTEDKLNTIILDDIKESIQVKTSANEYQVKGDPLKLQEYIDQLNSLVGLEKVKDNVFKLISGSKIAQLKRERGLHVVEKNYNAFLVGNPGTGKTTIAKLISLILKEIGILENGHLVKVTRSDLIGAYPEQTISQTESILKDAFGGTLLIDNAHSLIQDNNENGLVVLDTICRFIDNYKHKLIILLECSEIGNKNLITSYPILKEKFPHRFEFDNYSPRQLLTIAADISDNLGYILDEGALQVLLEIFSELYEKGELTNLNSKAAKSILYKAITNQEQRILGILNPSDIDLKTITLEDVQLVNY